MFFTLAVIGPIGGISYRLTRPAENSALILGARAGLALAQDDVTRVRFAIGDVTRAAGVKKGDHIIAIDGVPVSRVVPLDPNRARGGLRGTDQDYALFSPILSGDNPINLTMTLRGSDGFTRDVEVTTGENHIDQEAARIGLQRDMLKVIDLIHVLTYPILLWIAWLLRRRDDAVSALLSLGMLMTIGTEQPSATFLYFVAAVPMLWHRHLYDVANMCLAAALWLFPDARLRPRIKLVPLLGITVLPFLQGDAYRLAFACIILPGFVSVFVRLRHAPPTVRRQIKLLILSLALWPVGLTAALVCDLVKLTTSSMAAQLVFEALAGLTFGIAFAGMQFGLYAALERYRLRDADTVITRSASLIGLTATVTAVFAVIEGGVQSAFGSSGSAVPTIVAAAVAALLIRPIHGWVSGWAKGKFQKPLMQLRTGLPECVDDLRETASTADISLAAVERTRRGVAAAHVAVVAGNRVAASSGICAAAVGDWLDSGGCFSLRPEKDQNDPIFPLRIPLSVRHQERTPVGWLLVGPPIDGNFYSREEQRVLGEVADPIARALVIAQAREKRAAEEQQWRNGLERRMALLESGMAKLTV